MEQIFHFDYTHFEPFIEDNSILLVERILSLAYFPSGSIDESNVE